MLTDQPGCPAAWGGQAELWWDLKEQEDKKMDIMRGEPRRGAGRARKGMQEAGGGAGARGGVAKPGRKGRRGGGVVRAWDRPGHGGAGGRKAQHIATATASPPGRGGGAGWAALSVKRPRAGGPGPP